MEVLAFPAGHKRLKKCFPNVCFRPETKLCCSGKTFLAVDHRKRLSPRKRQSQHRLAQPKDTVENTIESDKVPCTLG